MVVHVLEERTRDQGIKEHVVPPPLSICLPACYADSSTFISTGSEEESPNENNVPSPYKNSLLFSAPYFPLLLLCLDQNAQMKNLIAFQVTKCHIPWFSQSVGQMSSHDCLVVIWPICLSLSGFHVPILPAPLNPQRYSYS